MQPPVAKFRIILQTFVDCGAEFVVIGGVAAGLLGAPVATVDLGVVHSRTPENLDRVLAALGTLDAYYREQPERRLRPTLSHLGSPGHQLLMTRAGPLDLLGTITGGRGYQELLPHTVVLESDSLSVRVVDLATLIRLKEERGRDKDRAMLPTLRRTLEEQERDQGGAK